MHKVQRDVEALYRAFGHRIGDHREPSISSPGLTADLIMEEAVETVEAITGRKVQWRFYGHEADGDLVAAIDGLCDLLCTTYGAAVQFGIDLEPFWNEVHRTNMAKQGGPVREDGKRLKPPGWEPPRIAEILAERDRTGEPLRW